MSKVIEPIYSEKGKEKTCENRRETTKGYEIDMELLCEHYLLGQLKIKELAFT